MKRLIVVLLGIMLLTTGVMVLVQLPLVQADSSNQTSTSFSPGQTYQKTIHISNPGTILDWSWTSSNYIESWVNGPNGQVDYYYPGSNSISYSNALWINNPGDYTFVWKSHNLIFSATVNYGIEWFQPTNAQMTSPQTGAISNHLNLTASGTMDNKATGASYSLDNVSYTPVMVGSTAGSWNANLKLSIGQNTLYFETKYVIGAFSYTNYQFFSIQTGFGLDFIPILQLNNPASGSTTTNLNPTIFGVCDANTSAVYVSLDNITFTQATKSSSNWKANLTLSSGSNTIYMRSDYQRGDFAYQYDSVASVNADTTWLYQSNGSTQFGIGMILAILAIIVILVLVLVYAIIRRRKKHLT